MLHISRCFVIVIYVHLNLTVRRECTMSLWREHAAAASAKIRKTRIDAILAKYEALRAH